MRPLVPVGILLMGLATPTWAAATATAPTTQPAVMQGRAEFQPLAEEDRLPAAYRLPAKRFTYRMRLIRVERTIAVYDVQFPSPVASPHPKNNTVHAEYYVGRDHEGPRPGVVVLHVIDGRFIVARMISRYLAERGAAALFVKMAYYGPRRPKAVRDWPFGEANLMDEAFRQSALDVRYARAWLASRPEVDPERIGLTGVSLGGIVAALAGSVETRFSRIDLVLAGGDLATIVYESPETRRFLKRWTAAGGTKEELARQVRHVDPLTHAQRLKGRDVLMVNGSRDRVVPVACTRRLWEAAGRPPIVWLDVGHYGIVAYAPALLRLLARHLAAWETIERPAIATQPAPEGRP